MKRALLSALCVALLTPACSDPASDQADLVAAAVEEGGVAGPFPATVRGTVDSSWPMDDGSGHIQLMILEYPAASFLVTEATFEQKGMDEEEAEVTLVVEPLPTSACGEDAWQCLKGS